MRCLALLLLVPLLLPAAARAQTVLRLQESGPEAGPEKAALEVLKAETETATHGAVRIELHYGAGTPGAEAATLESAMAGETALFSGDMRMLLPLVIDEVTGLDLPFMVPGDAAAQQYLASPLVGEGLGKVLDVRRIRVLETGALRGPERMLAAARPVASPDDLRGMRLAVFPTPTKPGIELWAALGVTIVTDVELPATADALAGGRIDGVVAPDAAALLAAGLGRAAPHVGPAGDHPQVWQVSINEGVWQKLGPDGQAALRAAVADAVAAYDRAAAAAQERDLAMLRAGGTAAPAQVQPLLAHEQLRAAYARLVTEGATTPRVRDTADAAIRQSGAAVSPFPVAPGGEFRDCPTCPVMVVVPAGRFLMGSPPTEKGRFDNEGPQRTVTVAHPFAISKYPVTMGELRAWQPGRGPDPIDQDPAVMVTWGEGGQYAAWLSGTTGRRYHLPTEAEYEYAERAGTTTPYPWGETIGTDNANCFGCGSRWDGRGSAPVGSFAPNRFGLHDMTGNTFVWVQDCYFDSQEGAPDDAFVARESTTGACPSRVLRASSWFNLPGFLRSAYRFHELPDARNSRRSFRLVID